MPDTINSKIKALLQQLNQLAMNVSMDDVQKEKVYKQILENNLPKGYLLSDEALNIAESFKQETIRKEFHKALDLLNANNSINSELVRAVNIKEMLELTCRLLVEGGKMSMAWIAWNNPETFQLEVLAVYGDTHDYVKNIKIYSDERPEGMGPTGTAFKEQRTVVVHSAFDDDRMEPWKIDRKNTNWNSSVAVPINLNGVTKGVLNVYALESNYFGEKEIDLIEALTFNLESAMERENYKSSLRTNEERLANVVEGAYLGIWEWNVQTNETTFNENWASMLGYTLDELGPTTLDTWRKLTHPDDVANALNQIKKHLNKETDSYTVDMRMKHKNGQWVWILDRGRVIKYDKDEKPLLMFGIHTEITERKNTEQALKQSEEKFRNMFDNSMVALAFRGLDGSLQVNDEYCKLLGYEPEELSKLSWQALTHPEDIEEGEKLLEDLLLGKIDFSQRNKRYIHKNGKDVWVEVRSRLQKDSEGNPLYVIAVVNPLPVDKVNKEKSSAKKLA